MSTNAIISKSEFLKHWQGHRGLTRKTIEKFPEKELFEFGVGGMRPFAALVKEVMAISGPGLESIATGVTATFNMYPDVKTKEELLKEWDAITQQITENFNQVDESKMHDMFNMLVNIRCRFFTRFYTWLITKFITVRRAMCTCGR